MLKRRTRRLIALGLCLMMLLSFGLTASAATTYPNTFSFELSLGGEKKQTSPVKKTVDRMYASIDFSTYSNKSIYPLLYRLRSGKNNTEASVLYKLKYADVYNVPYENGYGILGYSYYFRIQTDSSSLFDATVKGSWQP